MQEVDDGDGYSDDDLDALPVDTFRELQENALRSTQIPEHYDKLEHTVGRPVQLPDPAGRIADHGDLDNVFNNSFARDHAQQPSSDYGDFDDQMLDGEIFDAAEEPVNITGREGGVVGRPIGENTQREEFRQQRFGETSRLREYGWVQNPYGDRDTPNLVRRHGVRRDAFEDHDETMFLGHEKVHETPAQHTANSSAVDGLQAQIQEVPQFRPASFLISMTDFSKSYFENVILSKRRSIPPMNWSRRKLGR